MTRLALSLSIAALTLGAPPVLAMGDPPTRTPAEVIVAETDKALREARAGRLAKATSALSYLSNEVYTRKPLDVAAAMGIARGQRFCVQEYPRGGGNWLEPANQAFTAAVLNHIRMADYLYELSKSRSAAERAPQSAYRPVLYELMEAWIDLFPDIPATMGGAFRDQSLLAMERARERDRYRPKAQSLFGALRRNIQTDYEATAFRHAFKDATDQVMAANPTTLRLKLMLTELREQVATTPVTIE